MLRAMGRSSGGSVAGTAATQTAASARVMAAASARPIPATRGALAASERRVPPQSGQGPSVRKRLTRLRPFSSFALARAFSTV